jgi:hypothetical protein
MPRHDAAHRGAWAASQAVIGFATRAMLVVAVTVIAFASDRATVAGELLVGWAAADITPDRPVALAGQMRTRISRGVRDPVTCTALAIESRGADAAPAQAVLVACDLVSIPPQLEQAVAARHDALRAACPGLDPALIVLNATHSHAAPVMVEGKFELPPGTMTGAEYVEFAAGRIAAAVTEAWQSRAPGRVGWGLAHATLAHNRRVVSFDPATGLPAPGQTTMYGATDADHFDSLEAATDTAMPVVGFWDRDDRLTGLIINVAAPSQESEQSEEISADFWHEARAALRRAHGDGIFVLPQCAAAGGSSPRPLLRTVAEETMLRRRGLTRREEIARRIVVAVAEALDGARQEASADPLLRHTVKTLDLPQRIVTAADRDGALAAAAAVPPDRQPKARWHRATATRYDRQQKLLAEGLTPSLPVEVHAIRLGDVAFVTNPFELFEEFGSRIAGRSPAALTCVVQLAGGGAPGTYLPTARAVEGGGYSTTVESNLVGPEGGRMLVDESVALLRELWTAPASVAPPPATTTTATP